LKDWPKGIQSNQRPEKLSRILVNQLPKRLEKIWSPVTVVSHSYKRAAVWNDQLGTVTRQRLSKTLLKKASWLIERI
jgi:hypothetical protein